MGVACTLLTRKAGLGPGLVEKLEWSFMDSIPVGLVEIGKWFEPGCKAVLEFGGWKIAMLREFDLVVPDAFCRVERHWNSNEVFVLTTGHADLIVFEGEEGPTRPHILSMMPNAAYNVGKSVWHHVIMSRDAHIVIIERQETGLATTDYSELDPVVISDLKKLIGVDW
jgi:hypothetical protein